MNEMTSKIEILGIRSLVAPHLITHLSSKGFQGRCYSRTPPTKEVTGEYFPWSFLDAEKPGEWTPEYGAIVISAMPIWLLPKLLPRITACKQIIAFSSTSVFTKTHSRDLKEQALVAKLAEAELRIQDFCQANAISWTILRPTLIYDPGKDGNVSAIARFIKKWKFFPIASPGRGLRQPVHANDLAAATVEAIDNPQAFNRALNLGGGETLTYREMVTRIFESLGYKPLILPLPAIFPETGLKILGHIRNTTYSPELFRRMNQDLAFDLSEADTVLGYKPMPFRPTFRC